MKILLVDDEPDMVASLARNLKAMGFEVATASSGEEAIEVNLSWEPEAVIMDIMMPRMNGIDACLELQRVRPEVFVILMTGFYESRDEANQRLFSETCRHEKVHLMMKPLDPDQLCDLLQGEAKSVADQAGDALEWQKSIE